jgi:hypothetical protein
MTTEQRDGASSRVLSTELELTAAETKVDERSISIDLYLAVEEACSKAFGARHHAGPAKAEEMPPTIGTEQIHLVAPPEEPSDQDESGSAP